MRILFITDSLGFPHPSAGLSYQDSYLSKLEKLGNVWILGGGGDILQSSLARVKNICSVLDDKMFDIGIVHLGLVDCAPRPLSYSMHRMIACCPRLVVRIATWLIHNLRPLLLNIRAYQFTRIESFVVMFRELLQHMDRVCSCICIVSIAPIKVSLEKHSPGLGKQIAIYNDAIEQLANVNNTHFIDLSWLNEDEEKYLTDDAHIKSPVHEFIWSTLKELIRVDSC